jgi:hypothetical protein
MRRRLLVRLALVALASVVLFELSVRALLFADFADSWPLARELRSPPRFAHWTVDDLYWELQQTFAEVPRRREVPSFDPLVGWLGHGVLAGDRTHVGARKLGERRPVLLYGDSYSACLVAPGGCFQGVMERHPLGARYGLLNHGVGGYGLDQAALLFDATVDHYAERDPVVVMGILVDSDLDRCALSLRGWPKPRLEREGGVWRIPPEPVPENRSMAPGAAFYGWRLLLHTTQLVPEGVHDALCSEGVLEERNRERCAALLAWIAEGVERRGVEAFFLLFHRQGSLPDPGKSGWREPFLIAQLEALDLPWVSTRAPLLAHAEASGRPLDDYYQENGHLSALGNEAAFGAIQVGLAGRFGDGPVPEWSAVELAGRLTPDRIAAVVPGGPKGAARYEYGSRPPFTARERSRLCIRAAQQGPTDVRYDLFGRALAFEASARLMPVGSLGPGEGSVGLTLLVDGEPRARHVVRRGDEPLHVQVELTGSETLVLRVDEAGDAIHGDWLVLVDPTFREAD